MCTPLTKAQATIILSEWIHQQPAMPFRRKRMAQRDFVTLGNPGGCVIKFQAHSVNYPPILIEQPEDSKPFAPTVVTGSIDFDGLDPVSWWDDAEDKDEEPEDP
ncbi:hypothetical protein L3X38_036564 [Prunus dulcis]|uniref:Uncharacterized protein n=1 Tax=Prunus dulcis TaxID=3755 RepID=A0AAD4V3G4_PRUDU|nr:hypothetical protein L3X38_036564 [Prunus dulcis]